MYLQNNITTTCTCTSTVAISKRLTSLYNSFATCSFVIECSNMLAMGGAKISLSIRRTSNRHAYFLTIENDKRMRLLIRLSCTCTSYSHYLVCKCFCTTNSVFMLVSVPLCYPGSICIIQCIWAVNSGVSS